MSSPPLGALNYKRGTINVISGGFVSGGETNRVKEVYATSISMEATLGKRPCPNESITISFSDEDMEHVTKPHDDVLVITSEINGFDVKKFMVDS